LTPRKPIAYTTRQIEKERDMKTYHILNLGAGVQSTALYLMFMRGEIQDDDGNAIQLDGAIFGDTQDESEETYKHLEWMKSLGGPPILCRTKGKLSHDLEFGANGSNRCASIPAYVKKADYIDGDKASIVLRQCTNDYKIEVVTKAIKQEFLGMSKGQRVPKDVHVVQYFGLSADEMRRVLRVMREFLKIKWATCKFPLVEKSMHRQLCRDYMKDKVPHRVPRSACVYCPFHNNKEWARIQRDEPVSFAEAVRVDAMLRDGKSRCSQKLDGTLYLHKSMKPLNEIDFEKLAREDEDNGTETFFDCMGMCDT
jgi:hypothetical protein